MTTTLLTLGTFDIPHAGHANFLRQCSQFADEVIVGVNTDEFVFSYKGRNPLFNYEERELLVQLLGYEVVPNDSAGRETIELQQPDILAVGSDWATKDYYAQIDATQEFLDDREIKLLYIPYTPIISASEIKARMLRSMMIRVEEPESD